MERLPADGNHLDELSRRIIGCAFRVSNTLGAGFCEKVYENALAHELRKAKVKVEQQKHVAVNYDGQIVGNFYADLVVADSIILELKAAKTIADYVTVQCLNFLAATKLPLCLMLNFGNAKVEIKRFRN